MNFIHIPSIVAEQTLAIHFRNNDTNDSHNFVLCASLSSYIYIYGFSLMFRRRRFDI